MRLLTPNEQRQVEALKADMVKRLWSSGDTVEIIITINDRELWLNLFEIILKKNDEMKDTWLKSSNPQI